MSHLPLALPPALPHDLLDYVLSHQAYPTTLIICQPRAAFLHTLLHCLPDSIPNPPYLPESKASETGRPSISEPVSRHPLLVPTLFQIGAAKNINLVFISTVTHLRAYLAVFGSEKNEVVTPSPQNARKVGRNVPLLVVYGLVGLHRDSSDWSAQGLGTSLAGLVEAGNMESRKIILLEERIAGEGDDYGDVVGEEIQKKPLTGWEEAVPMLNGSVRRYGLDNVDGGWSGRTVEVGSIVARWFEFGLGDRNESALLR